MSDDEYIYDSYSSDDSDYEQFQADVGLKSGGRRTKSQLQPGNTINSSPYQFQEMMKVASAGKKPTKEKQMLEQKLGCEGGRRKPLIKKKTMRKIANHPITKHIIHDAVKAGLAYATDGASLAAPPSGGKNHHLFRKAKNTVKTIRKNPIVQEVEKEAISQGKDAVRSYVGGGRARRGAIVSKVMKEKGLSLAQASKYVKEHGLY